VRFLVYGAGAVGGVVGGRLFQAGHDVTLVARGKHAAVINARGLRLESPGEVATLSIPVVQDLSGRWAAGSAVVLLAVKSQDTVPAVGAIADAGLAEAVVCLQNGVDNERAALRSFGHVYGVCVMLPAAHLEPGIVTAHSAPTTGLLDIGRYPVGVDGRAERIADAFRSATFGSEPRPDIMRWKYRKLVMNLGNAVQALCGPLERRGAALEVLDLLDAEATRCFETAGIEVTSVEEDQARRGDHLAIGTVEGRPRPGGSTYQSLQRATGRIETDYLNGEICLLGRRYGVPTPANAAVQALANRAARERWAPGRLSPDDLLAVIAGDGSALAAAGPVGG
jgi:2-dehydropantoate 2-reductase